MYLCIYVSMYLCGCGDKGIKLPAGHGANGAIRRGQARSPDMRLRRCLAQKVLTHPLGVVLCPLASLLSRPFACSSFMLEPRSALCYHIDSSAASTD